MKRAVVTYDQIKNYYTNENADKLVKDKLLTAMYNNYNDFAFVMALNGYKPTESNWKEFKDNLDNRGD